MEPNNPFLITGYYSPDYFCDREKETEIITNALYNGRDLTLIAPRRMGKTGLIKNAFYELEKGRPEIATLYMDIYSTQNLEDFVRLFSSVVLGQLDSISQKTMSKIGQFIKSCRPVFTFDELTGAPQVTIDMIPSAGEATLKEVFNYLQSSNKRCYIAIDEFQQISEYPEKGIEALLRSYIQFLPNVNFIFAGSKQHVIQEMFLSAKRPFYQSTQTLSIGKIDKNEYYRFGAGFFQKQGRDLEQEVFDYLYDEFDGHTWYIQVLLNRLYGNKNRLDIAAVNHSIDEIVAESTYAYEHLLDAYSSSNIKLLKAIAREKCVKEVNSGGFIAKYGLKAASSVNTSLRKLIDKELIYQTMDGYLVYDRFLSIWLRRQVF